MYRGIIWSKQAQDQFIPLTLISLNVREKYICKIKLALLFLLLIETAITKRRACSFKFIILLRNFWESAFPFHPYHTKRTNVSMAASLWFNIVYKQKWMEWEKRKEVCVHTADSFLPFPVFPVSSVFKKILKYFVYVAVSKMLISP